MPSPSAISGVGCGQLRVELQNADHLKGYAPLLEVQLKEHFETASSECQNYLKEVAAFRQLLAESQGQLEAVKAEVQWTK